MLENHYCLPTETLAHKQYMLCLMDWRPYPCEPDLSIQSTKYNEVLLKLQIVLFCNMCMDIVVNLFLIMSLNLQIFGVLKKKFLEWDA